MSIYFNGSTQYGYTSGSIAEIPLSVAFWFNLDSMGAANQQLWTIRCTSVPYQEFGCYISKNLALCSTRRDARTNTKTATTPNNTIVEDTWYRVVCDFPSTAAHYLYLNSTQYSSTGTCAPTLEEPQLEIANYSTGNLYCGAIAEFAIWSTYLDLVPATFLSYRKYSPLFFKLPNLVNYYPFVTHAKDMRINYDFTLSGSPTYVTHVEAKRPFRQSISVERTPSLINIGMWESETVKKRSLVWEHLAFNGD